MWGGDKGVAQILSHLVENGVAKGLGSAGFVGGKTPRWQIGAAAEIAIYLGRAIRW
jgi:hypothetical protein